MRSMNACATHAGPCRSSCGAVDSRARRRSLTGPSRCWVSTKVRPMTTSMMPSSTRIGSSPRRTPWMTT